jgi:high-affinity K+ transport system ATPase subunit B
LFFKSNVIYRSEVITEADKEIISILKELIRKKESHELIDPDDLLREKIIKIFGLMSLILIILSFISKMLGQSQEGLGLTSSTTFTLFLMMLFMHLNNKSKNPSIILYVLTFLSAMIPIWFT